MYTHTVCEKQHILRYSTTYIFRIACVREIVAILWCTFAEQMYHELFSKQDNKRVIKFIDVTTRNNNNIQMLQKYIL